MFFRNVTRSGSIFSCILCVALSAVYLQLDEKEKQMARHEEIMQQERADRIRAIRMQSPLPQKQSR